MATHVNKTIRGTNVVETLERLKQSRGAPEFISKTVDLWAYQEGVRLHFSRPGKPTDNAMIESFNGSCRCECFETNWFLSLENARSRIERWWIEYNQFRPNSSLGYRTPSEFAQEHELLNPAF